MPAKKLTKELNTRISTASTTSLGSPPIHSILPLLLRPPLCILALASPHAQVLPTTTSHPSPKHSSCRLLLSIKLLTSLFEQNAASVLSTHFFCGHGKPRRVEEAASMLEGEGVRVWEVREDE
ncbi:MAG: hypothetical protein Q9222_003694 [Ikaeria aurantiellina]